MPHETLHIGQSGDSPLPSKNRVPTHKKKDRRILFNSLNNTKELKERAVKSAGITISSQIVGYSLQMIGTIWIAHFVTPNDFGLVTMVFVFSLLLQNLGENGFTEYILQKNEIDHQQLSNLFWLNLGLNFFLTVAFMLFAPFIAWFYHEPKLYRISLLMSLSIVFGALPIQHLALLKRNMKFFGASVNDVASGFLSTGIAIVLAMGGLGYWAIVIRRVANPFFKAIGGWILCSWIPSVPKKSKEIWSMLKFVFNTYGNFTVLYASRNLDKFLIGKFYGESFLGFYDRAYHLSMFLPNQLSASLTSVAITTLSKLVHDEQRFKRIYKNILSVVSLGTIPLSTILALTGKDLIIVLLGAQWEDAGEIFKVFAPCIGLMVLHATTGWVHLSLGRADRWLKWGFVRVTCASISIMIGLIWGPKGVAAAYSIYMFITLLPALIYAGKPLGINFNFLLGVLWKYVTAGVFSFIFCQFIILNFNEVNELLKSWGPMARFSVLSISCTISYCSFIFVLFRGIEPFYLVIEVLRELFKKSERRTSLKVEG